MSVRFNDAKIFRSLDSSLSRPILLIATFRAALLMHPSNTRHDHVRKSETKPSLALVSVPSSTRYIKYYRSSYLPDISNITDHCNVKNRMFRYSRKWLSQIATVSFLLRFIRPVKFKSIDNLKITIKCSKRK